MKNFKKYITITFLISTLFVACTQEFLEYDPVGVSPDVVFFSTVEGIQQGVTGTYSSINDCVAVLHTLDVMHLAFGSFASDEAEAGGEPGGNDILDFQNWDKGLAVASESRSVSENFYAYHYKIVLRAISTINGIKTYREKNPERDDATNALLDQFEGEMEFLLAFAHFKLMKVYGGIPIVDHPLASSEYGITKNTVAECLHFIQEHLQIAAELLPLKSQYTPENEGRAAKGSAESLLAKAYLFEASYAENYAGDARFEGCTNTYSKALEAAEKVINSGEYKLLGIDGETFDTYWNQNGSPMYSETPGYRYIFTVAGENSLESVFEVQAVNDAVNYMLSQGTYLTIYTNVRNTGSGTLGWGFNCPTEELLNTFDPEDPRKKVTIGENDDPIYISSGWNTMVCRDSPTNMHTRKFEASPAEYWDNSTTSSGPTNFPHIRYADVVLFAAEAALKSGNNDSALKYINMIRKRARNGASSGIPADLTGISFDDIVKERSLELAMEGHRFFDVVRWNITDVLNGQPLQKYLNGELQSPPYTTQFTPGKNEFFPFPAAEIINSNGNLIQNPGY